MSGSTDDRDHTVTHDARRMLAAHLGGDPRAEGEDAAYDGLPIKEVAHMALSVDGARSRGRPLIARPRRPRLVGLDARELLQPRERARARERAQLRLAAVRLRAAAGATSWRGSCDRLRADPASRSATITTFEPLRDTSVHPVRQHARLLGARRRGSSSSSTPTASTSARRRTATSSSSPACRSWSRGELGLPVGRLTVLVKSAHVYEPEWELMAGLAAPPPG